MVSKSEVLDIAQRNVFNLDPMLQKQVLELVQLLGGEDTRKAAEDMIVQTTPGLSIRIERVAAILSSGTPSTTSSGTPSTTSSGTPSTTSTTSSGTPSTTSTTSSGTPSTTSTTSSGTPSTTSTTSSGTPSTTSTTSSGTPSTASNALIPGWRAEKRKKKDVVTIDSDSDSDSGWLRRPRSLTDETKNKNKTDSVDTQPFRRTLRPRLTQPLQGVEVIEDNTGPGLLPAAIGLLTKKKKSKGGRALLTAERQECLMHAWDTPNFHKSCQLASFAWLRSYDLHLQPWGSISKTGRTFSQSRG